MNTGGYVWGHVIYTFHYTVHCKHCIMVGKMMAMKNENRDDNNGGDQTPIDYTDE